MILFFALLSVAIAISGLLGFLFFWAMAQVHLRDRSETATVAQAGAGFASPRALVWLLRGGYRESGDAGLAGLCIPAQVSLWTVIAGLAAAGALAAWAAAA